MTTTQSPRSISDLVKIAAKYGKKAQYISGIDASGDKTPPGKVVVDLGGIDALNEIEEAKGKVLIGTGLNLGRVAREADGENGLLRQAASLIANPLVRNRI